MELQGELWKAITRAGPKLAHGHAGRRWIERGVTSGVSRTVTAAWSEGKSWAGKTRWREKEKKLLVRK